MHNYNNHIMITDLYAGHTLRRATWNLRQISRRNGLIGTEVAALADLVGTGVVDMGQSKLLENTGNSDT